MALLVMCLTHKHEDLILIPRMYVKVVVVAVPSTQVGEGRNRLSWPDNQATWMSSEFSQRLSQQNELDKQSRSPDRDL